MSKPSPTQTLVLITCILMLATQCQAQELARAGGGGRGGGGGGGGGRGGGSGGLGGWFGGAIRVTQCLKSIVNVPGCLKELLFAVVSFQPRLIGPVCCRAFLEVGEDCWPLLFPSSPNFPPSLKEHCEDGGGSRFATSKAVTDSSDGGSDGDDNLI